MSNGIHVDRIAAPVAWNTDSEFVERKGIGHPDSLIDGICDAVSVELSKEYLDKTGVILHHNVDKGLVVGGEAKVWFGGGKLDRKIEVIVAGRATREFEGKKFDVSGIATQTAAKYLEDHTRFLDIGQEVGIASKVYPGSADLSNLFSRRKEVPLANDTSFGAGFAPFTDLESIVLKTEQYLNSKEYKAKVPAVGEDIKVMGLRTKGKITLTVAIAFVSKFVADLEGYAALKEKVGKDILKFAEQVLKGREQVDVQVNTGDNAQLGEIYLTKTGLSCEHGDDGSVGRGNRVNGLITPFRTMSLEAAAGKNPVSHVGKIYNILAAQLANDIVREAPSVKNCEVVILSQIGRRIDQPQSLSVRLSTEDGAKFDAVKSKADYVSGHWLERIGDLTTDISLGKYPTF